MKKFLALALALMMVFSLATTAFAATAQPGPFTVTIKNATGHTYKIYQIFTGDLSTNEANKEVLSNIVFGTDYLPEKGEDENGVMTYYVVGEEVPDSILANPTGITPTGAGTAMSTSADGKTATASGLVAGYYMVVDVTEPLPDGDTRSAVIFQVVGDTEVTSKHDSTPKTYKKIDDKNDSTGAEDEIVWHDSADHDIGDLIDFQLNAVIPSSIEVFREYNEDKTAEKKKPYRFVFHDVEEQGLTFDSITSVYVWNDTNGDNTVDDDEKTTITDSNYHTLIKEPDHNKDNKADCTFDVVFEDLTTIEAIRGGSVLVVEYRSRLNEEAVIGEDGNVNKMRGEYSNFNKPEEPSFTPWDNVIAFTYKVVVNKVDEAGAALEGAEFTLQKFVVSENGTDQYVVDEKTTLNGTWVTKTVVKTEEGTVFTFTGLDDGYYRLTETETPVGYNTIKPIYFTVTAEHDIEWTTQDRTEVLDSLTGEKETGEVREITFTASDDKGTLTTDVINNKGTVLPETGGMGTTIFYAVGGVLAAAAVVLLVAKKRASSAK